MLNIGTIYEFCLNANDNNNDGLIRAGKLIDDSGDEYVFVGVLDLSGQTFRYKKSTFLKLYDYKVTNIT